ncbi:hypothetical protein ACJIZ3_020202 [Penstemon smallii]|uniref:F-box domain-containing protein n=1 Tax=Penstemon smallii TaxID=265156 RepID=A0ABD3SIS4_9LAMI
MMNFLVPEDLMIEILVCLPVKSIVRFRCVSKTWCNMVKSPSFINHHLRNQRRRNVLLVRRCLLPPPQYDDVLSFHDPNSPELEEVCPNLSIPFLKDLRMGKPGSCTYNPNNIRILGGCNGLVCIFYINFVVILCNPALREFKMLPPFPLDSAYYPSRIGFGITACTNDFKVVLLLQSRDEYCKSPYTVNMYSSSTSSWKQIHIAPTTQVGHMEMWSELFFNGVCHWPATRSPKFERAILCFDLSTEVLGWLEYPDISYERSKWSRLMVMNECFAVVWLNLFGRAITTEIWVMKEYGVRESWTKQFSIQSFTDIRFSPFLPWKNDQWMLLLESGDVDPSGQLVSCSFHSNEIKKYRVYGEKGTLKPLIYQESLISLDKF